MNRLTQESILHTYRLYAPIYDFIFGPILEHGRRILAKLVADQQPDNLLEIGVGTGLAAIGTPAGRFECGIDISHEMLVKALKRSRASADCAMSLIRGDAQQLPFPDDSFDCVTIPYVLSVTPDPDALLCEVRRVCSESGTIYILNHFRGARGWQLLEQLVAPIADKVGFSSGLELSTVYSDQWTVESVHTANPLGLSRLVVIKNSRG